VDGAGRLKLPAGTLAGTRPDGHLGGSRGAASETESCQSTL